MSHHQDWAEMRRLAETYAMAMDRNRPDLLETIFTQDAVLAATAATYEGIERILTVPGWLQQRYIRTFHAVFNHRVEVTGDTAEGEAYCRASHLFKSPSGTNTINYEMMIRYQDRYRRVEGAWKFSRRELVVDWTQVTEAVQSPAQPVR